MIMSSVTGHSSLRLIGLYRIVRHASACVPVGLPRMPIIIQSTFGKACRRDRAVSGSSPHGCGAGGPGGMRLRRSPLSFDQEPTCTVQRTLRVTALPLALRGPRARARRGAVHGGAQQHGSSGVTAHGALPVLSLQVPLVYRVDLTSASPGLSPVHR